MSNSLQNTEKSNLEQKRVLYIHVGPPKTGSFSIQKTLFNERNKSIIKNAGLSYISEYKKHCSSPMLHLLFSSNPQNNMYCRTNRLSRKQIFQQKAVLKEQLSMLMQRIDSGNLLLSDEQLYALSHDELLEMKQFFQSRVSQNVTLKIVTIIRNPQTWVNSRIQQRIKFDGSTIEEQLELYETSKTHFYKDQLPLFCDVFGEENILLLNFEDLTNSPQCFVKEFLIRLGITSKQVDAIEEYHANDNFSAIAIDMISFINDRLPLYFGNWKSIDRAIGDTNVFSSVKGAPFQLTADEFDRIKPCIISNMEWLKSQYGIEYALTQPKQTRDIRLTAKRLFETINILPKLSLRLQNLVFIYLNRRIFEETKSKRNPIARAVLLWLRIRRKMRDVIFKFKEYTSRKKSRKTLFLHVGMHKTGTTAIQSFLAQNAERLRESGIYVPVQLFDGNNKINGLVASIKKKNHHLIDKYLSIIQSQAIINNCHSIILSDEDYYNYINDEADCLRFFREHFDVKIILYLRRQDFQVESMYAFSVQFYSSRDSLKWYLDLPPKDYSAFLESCKRLFPDSEIILRNYDKCKKQDPNIINDFISLLDLNQEDCFVYPDKTMSNITPNKHIIEFLRRMNHIELTFEEFENLKTYLIEYSILKHGPSNIYFTYQQRLDYLAAAQKGNQKLAAFSNSDAAFFDDVELLDVPDDLDDETEAAVYKDLERFDPKLYRRIRGVDTIE